MGLRRDLERAKQRADLAARARIELVRDEDGTVREVRTLPMAPRSSTGSTADLPFTNASEAPDAVVLRRKQNGSWHSVTAVAFAAEVTAVAKGLMAAGLEPGGRVAVMSRTRYEWTVLDFAVWAAGGRSVPVYATSSTEQVEWIVRDSGARHVVTETPDNTATVTTATAVSRAESIRAFTLVEGEFTEENGLLTPSLKIKRHAVTAAYADQIEVLYRRR